MAWVATVTAGVGAVGGLLGGGGGGGAPAAPPGPVSQTVTFGNKGTPSWVLPSIIGTVVIGAAVVVISLNRRK